MASLLCALKHRGVQKYGVSNFFNAFENKFLMFTMAAFI